MEPMNVSRGKAGILAALMIGAAFFSPGYGQDQYERARRSMVLKQLAARDITDKRVLEAMSLIPRHLFVPLDYRDQAYEDYPLPIKEGQTISQPYIVALMTQALGLKGKEKVLEIGTGSGYQAAVLSRLAGRVFSVEILEVLARKARQTLETLGFTNVLVKQGDGYFGWPGEAPFDGILVTCASREVPPSLIEQLREGGRLIIPLGETLAYQTLTLVTKVKGKPQFTPISEVRFVPMTGEIQKKKKFPPTVHLN